MVVDGFFTSHDDQLCDESLSFCSPGLNTSGIVVQPQKKKRHRKEEKITKDSHCRDVVAYPSLRSMNKLMVEHPDRWSMYTGIVHTVAEYFYFVHPE